MDSIFLKNILKLFLEALKQKLFMFSNFSLTENNSIKIVCTLTMIFWMTDADHIKYEELESELVDIVIQVQVQEVCA